MRFLIRSRMRESQDAMYAPFAYLKLMGGRTLREASCHPANAARLVRGSAR